MIAIHFISFKKDRFSSYWIEYCKINSIPYKIVNCFDNNIIDQLKDCKGLMFHFYLGSFEKMLFAKQLIYSVEHMGLKVFPNFKTVWHYDDKIGQKYLFDSIHAPAINTYIFYELGNALNWIEKTSFPKVFKLRNGASSSNVRLINTKEEAKKITKIAFNSGFSHKGDSWKYLKERWRQYRLGKSTTGGVKYAIKRLLGITKEVRFLNKESGYVYFQDFIPQNNFDIRIIVIDKKAFAIKRMVRENDFRASGSGLIKYEKENFSNETLSLAFDLAYKLGSQCIAFDFIFLNNQPIVVEISYCFTSLGVYEKCLGYWDKELNWFEGPFNPYGWMVESLLNEINLKA